MPRPSEGDIVGHIYDAAFGAMGWDEVAAEMVGLFDGTTLNLLEIDPTFQAAELIATHGFTESHHETFKSHFVAHDLWSSEAFRKRLLGQPLISADFVSDDVFANSIIYNEFLKDATGSFFVAGGVIRTARNTLVSFGAHRPRDATAFDAESRETFKRLIPHLKRATDIRARVSNSTASMTGQRLILDRLATPLVQIGVDGKILFVNEAAEAILRQADGLTSVGNELTASLPDENRKLQGLISAVVAATIGSIAPAPGGWIRVSRPTGGRPYYLLVSPLGHQDSVLSGAVPAALVFIGDPRPHSSLTFDALNSLFGLTQAECRIVRGIVAGKSLPTIAAESGVSHNTVRTLLGRAMAKTETRAQTELVSLVLSTFGNIRTS